MIDDDVRAVLIGDQNRRAYLFLQAQPGTLLAELDALRGDASDRAVTRLCEIMVLLNVNSQDVRRRWGELDAHRLTTPNRVIQTFG